MKQLINKVIQWADDKGILENGTTLAQLGKTEEEVAELRESLEAQSIGLKFFFNSKGDYVNTREQIKDDIGDSLVTLIIQAKMQGMDIEDCLQSAYDVISKRKGEMKNGTFVKDEKHQ